MKKELAKKIGSKPTLTPVAGDIGSQPSNVHIPPELIKNDIAFFKSQYPGFLDFKNPGDSYLKDERSYKEKICAQAKQILMKYTGSAESAIESFNQLLEIKDNNFFNWRDKEHINVLPRKDLFGVGIKELFDAVVKSDVVSADQFDIIARNLKESGLAYNLHKQIITFVLFAVLPSTYLMMKSTNLDRVLKRYGYPKLGQGQYLTYKMFQQVSQFSADIKYALAELKPGDMIDIQSFLHIIASINDKQVNVPISKNSIAATKNSENEGLLMRISPTNTILYGPPGTGKTYNSINHALSLCQGKALEQVIEEDRQNHQLMKDLYTKLRKEGRISFCTFHQSMSYEDFVEGIKPKTQDNKVVYQIEPGVFSEICERAQNNWENSRSTDSVTFDKVWKVFIDPLLAEDKTDLSVKTKRGSFKIYDVNDRTIYFEKQNKSRVHTLSIKTLKRVFEDPKQLDLLGGLKNYYQALVDGLKKVKMPKLNDETLEQFVLIIDEINRGNVSAILGELITLLEPDKRLGQANELRVTLPYSKEPDFGVPPNLHIIGTMNTADRSVEALDTALRRRFSFVEMLPKPTLLKEIEIEGVNLETLLMMINKRIEYLLDRDHKIGHSYFLNVKSLNDLQTVFNDKIIPLLQEYFYGDYNKIGLVLGKGFVDVSDTEPIFADGDFESAHTEVKIYNLLHPNGEEFTKALKFLLNMSLANDKE